MTRRSSLLVQTIKPDRARRKRRASEGVPLLFAFAMVVLAGLVVFALFLDF
jgi:hypothetical protein